MYADDVTDSGWSDYFNDTLKMAGIYIHIPFCKQACHYCNFHFSTSMADKPRMVQAIISEIELKAEAIHDPISTIYLGGGTPSLLSADELNAIFKSLDDNFNIEQNAEITLEINPDDVDENYIRMIRNSPVNRLSIGIQSFHDADLKYMNRAHSASEARRSIELCLAADIKNMTVDLIYGVPGLANPRWAENIDILAAYDIPHLSCYQLTVENKTPLEAFIQRGSHQAPSDEMAVEQFYILLDKMEEHGYEAYEISNYAKAGFKSRHNSSYWQGEHYLGFGPSAHSFIGRTRSWNTVVNNRYMEEIESGNIPENHEELTPANQYNEFILTRLRTIEGISLSDIHRLFPIYFNHFTNAIASPLKGGLIDNQNGHVVLTREGKVWADAVTGELMI
jgi:oxygen-independent coproporphyrinogen-3 oxidase